jgi:hypothetical protein
MTTLFALTIKEPWLWAILHADKRVENRNYPPPAKVIGTRIALHSSKSFDQDGAEFLWSRHLAFPSGLLLGSIVGVATVRGFVQRSADPWFTGPFGWVLTSVRSLPEPILCRGMLGLWPVNEVMTRRINGQLTPQEAA